MERSGSRFGTRELCRVLILICSQSGRIKDEDIWTGETANRLAFVCVRVFAFYERGRARMFPIGLEVQAVLENGVGKTEDRNVSYSPEKPDPLSPPPFLAIFQLLLLL